jgi:aldose 1-epimerase
MPKIETRPFGVTRAGESVQQFILTNSRGASVRLMNLGAAVTHIFVPDRHGQFADVTLGWDEFSCYENNPTYFSVVVGRFANRIARGRFTLDGVTYQLPINNGPNHLHGGPRGIQTRFWEAQIVQDSVRFSLLDPDGAEGYPGNVQIALTYSWSNSNALRLEYQASTDKPTPINLSHHAYFNLKDGGRTTILDHLLSADADRYTPVDETLVPTGEIAPVKGTPLDFTSPKPIGRDGFAYDHNLVLCHPAGEFGRAVTLTDPASRRTMEVWTTEPGVQFYSGNFLDGSVIGKGGAVYHQFAGLCLECQHFPDSPNRPEFPGTILRPGQIYRQITEYRFR